MKCLLWILDKRDFSDIQHLDGESFLGSWGFGEEKPDFAGEVYLLHRSGRTTRMHLRLSYSIVEWVGHFWACKPAVDASPPFLLTDEPGMNFVYDGPVGFELAEGTYLKLPRRGVFTIAVTNGQWYGVLTRKVTGFLRRVEHWSLVAFSEIPGLSVADCVVVEPFEPEEPDESIGRLSLPHDPNESGGPGR